MYTPASNLDYSRKQTKQCDGNRNLNLNLNYTPRLIKSLFGPGFKPTAKFDLLRVKKGPLIATLSMTMD